MKNKKLLTFWPVITAISLSMISPAALTEQASSEQIYNPRDEVLYGYRALLEREETRNEQIHFQQYQQQQYLEQQRMMDQQNMYNQAHQKNAPNS